MVSALYQARNKFPLVALATQKKEKKSNLVAYEIEEFTLCTIVSKLPVCNGFKSLHFAHLRKKVPVWPRLGKTSMDKTSASIMFLNVCICVHL